MNLATNLLTTESRHPDRVALIAEGLQLTYAEFLARVRDTAAFLDAKGIVAGDRVGLMLPNVPAFAILYHAALLRGCTVVPMNPLLSGREVTYYLSDSGARLLFAATICADPAEAGAEQAGTECLIVGPNGPDVPPGQAELVERADDDTAIILYTSGTTGQPKGAELTHHNMLSNARVSAETLLYSTEGDVIMGCLPLVHVFGLTCGLNAAVYTGSALALLPRFQGAAALELIARERVTIFEGVPTMYSDLLHAPNATDHDTSTLRVCISGGAAMPVEVLTAFERAFGTMVLEGYGLSETSPVVSFNHPNAERKLGSIGQPIDGVQVRIVDKDGAEVATGEVGELAVAGENVMKGYWGRPEATAEAIPDGWLRTGDLGRADEDGYLYIVDRKKQLIIRGGYNVYPREVEEVFYAHPAVAEVAVIGLTHSRLGEEVAAAVVLAPNQQVSAAELREFGKQRLAAYKYPRHVWTTEALPKGPTGKILHREVVPPADVVVE